MTAGDCGSMAPGREDRFFDEIEPQRVAQLLIDADEPPANDRYGRPSPGTWFALWSPLTRSASRPLRAQG